MNAKAGKSLSPSFGYISTLDGWRAISVLAVLYFHCIQNGLSRGSFWGRIASRGHLGVDVFFAISGFLICGKLLQELRESGTISLKNFYIRRCFRIFPAVWAYLLVLAILSALGWITTQKWEFASTLFFVRNYFPLYHQGTVFGRYTGQFWSLAVEEHFYLLWPVTMLLLGPKLKRIGWAALLAALAVSLWRTADQAHGWLTPFGVDVHSKTDTRIDALFWGCLVAIVYPYIHEHLKESPIGRNLWIPVCLAVAAMVFLKNVPGGSLIKSILFPAMIMCTVISPKSLIGRFLEWQPLRWIGRLSYSIYIWQQLTEFRSTVPNSPIHVMQQFPYNLAVVFLLASASYYFVERPLNRIGHRLTPRSGSKPSIHEQPILIGPKLPLAASGATSGRGV
jgi:peptidoglycan/LPS O-acetylase OafA/YrhL